MSFFFGAAVKKSAPAKVFVPQNKPKVAATSSTNAASESLLDDFPSSQISTQRVSFSLPQHEEASGPDVHSTVPISGAVTKSTSSSSRPGGPIPRTTLSHAANHVSDNLSQYSDGISRLVVNNSGNSSSVSGSAQQPADHNVLWPRNTSLRDMVADVDDDSSLGSEMAHFNNSSANNKRTNSSSGTGTGGKRRKVRSQARSNDDDLDEAEKDEDYVPSDEENDNDQEQSKRRGRTAGSAGGTVSRKKVSTSSSTTGTKPSRTPRTSASSSSSSSMNSMKRLARAGLFPPRLFGEAVERFTRHTVYVRLPAPGLSGIEGVTLADVDGRAVVDAVHTPSTETMKAIAASSSFHPLRYLSQIQPYDVILSVNHLDARYSTFAQVLQTLTRTNVAIAPAPDIYYTDSGTSALSSSATLFGSSSSSDAAVAHDAVEGSSTEQPNQSSSHHNSADDQGNSSSSSRSTAGTRPGSTAITPGSGAGASLLGSSAWALTVANNSLHGTPGVIARGSLKNAVVDCTACIVFARAPAEVVERMRQQQSQFLSHSQ